MAMTIARKIALGFAIALCIILVMNALSYQRLTQMIESNKMVAQTLEVLSKTTAAFSALQDVESGQRGYAITGNAEFLKAYTRGNSEITTSLDELAALVSENPQQVKRVEKVRDLIADRVEHSRQVVDARRKDGFAAAAAIVANQRGLLIMEEIRSVIKEIDAEEHALLKRRNEDSAANVDLLKNTLWWGTAGGILLLVVFGYVLSRSITDPVRETSVKLAATSAQLLARVTQQAAGAQEQASAVAQTVTTADEVAQTADQAAERARAVGESVQRAVEVGRDGRKSVEESVATLGTLQTQVQSTAESILKLAEQAQAISDIIAAVDDLSDQSNLLALNAAIEASRAGEHGKGFAVVAREVKTMAEQSKKATVQVRQILGEIQRATNKAVLSTEEVTRGVAAAARVSDQSGETIRLLADTLSDTSKAAAQIVASMGQQATGTAQILEAMKNIDEVARQTMAATRESEATARVLTEQGAELRRLI